MRRIVAAAVLAAGCASPLPDAPAVHVIALDDAPADPRWIDGASAWSPLGFDVSPVDSGAVECSSAWHLEPVDLDCQITIGVRRVSMLRERAGTNARSFRDQRLVEIDARVTDLFDVLLALSHEAGHILLDTAQHTTHGVMAGDDYVIGVEDRRLACDTINICTSIARKTP